MEKLSLDAMIQENDKAQALYRTKAALCKNALSTFEACKHYKNIDKKMCTRHNATFPNEYLCIDLQYTPRVTIYSRELTYNEQISFYLQAHSSPSWSNLIEVATKAMNDFSTFAEELEAEKLKYIELMKQETTLKEIQGNAENMKLSYVSQKFFPRLFCSKCRYN